MQKFTFDRRKTDLFTEQQNLLAYEQERLLPFIGRIFSLENLEKQLQEKSVEYGTEKRKVLVNTLRKQYSSVPVADRVQENIEALMEEKTFTITTGHQLSLFTGPVFFIYKILHVIRLCEVLKETFAQYHFVPVFWMAGEDHDLEEVRSVEVFDKTLCWETDQEGAVGRMSTEGMDTLIAALRTFFQGSNGLEVDAILSAYSGETQAEAMLGLVNALFGAYGLVCIDGDNRSLKQLALPVFRKELEEGFSKIKVDEASRLLAQEGYKVQMKSRDVNLFYLNDLARNKILKEPEGFFFQGEGVLDETSSIEQLEKYPERFSPNVVLRPVYQEFILPNLCYVGGVGELSYWLQLKGVFKASGVLYPLILPRTSILYLDATSTKRMEKSDLKLEDLFLDKEVLKRNLLKLHEGQALDFSSIDQFFEHLKEELRLKILSVDSSLDKYAEAECVKLKKISDGIKDKLTRTLKQKYDDQMRTIDKLFAKLFPDGIMQERVLNIFSTCPDGNIHKRIHQLYAQIDPLDLDLMVLLE